MFMKLKMWIDIGNSGVWLHFQKNPPVRKIKWQSVFNVRVRLAGVLAESVTTCFMQYLILISGFKLSVAIEHYQLCLPCTSVAESQAPWPCGCVHGLPL